MENSEIQRDDFNQGFALFLKGFFEASEVGKFNLTNLLMCV